MADKDYQYFQFKKKLRTIENAKQETNAMAKQKILLYNKSITLKTQHTSQKSKENNLGKNMLYNKNTVTTISRPLTALKKNSSLDGLTGKNDKQTKRLTLNSANIRNSNAKQLFLSSEDNSTQQNTIKLNTLFTTQQAEIPYTEQNNRFKVDNQLKTAQNDYYDQDQYLGEEKSPLQQNKPLQRRGNTLSIAEDINANRKMTRRIGLCQGIIDVQELHKNDKKGKQYANILLNFFKAEKEKLEKMQYDKKVIIERISDLRVTQTEIINQLIIHMQYMKINDTNFDIITQDLPKLVEIAMTSKNTKLQMFIQLQSAKLLQEMKNIRQCATKFRILRELADKCCDYVFKYYLLFKYKRMKSYHGIAKSLIILRKYDQAKQFIFKLLQLSWFCKKERHEIKAYFLLALTYYYTGDIDKAKYYEDRSILNHCEDKNSYLRKMCVKFFKHTIFIKDQKKNTISYFKQRVFCEHKNKDDSMNLNSSDDEIEIDLMSLVPQPDKKTHLEMRQMGLKELFKSCKKKSLIKFQIRDQLLYNNTNDRNFFIIINIQGVFNQNNSRQANKNIRQLKHVDSEAFINNRPKIHVDLNAIKYLKQSPHAKMYFCHLNNNLNTVQMKQIQRKDDQNSEIEKFILQGQQKEHWDPPNNHKISKIISKICVVLNMFMGISDHYFTNLFLDEQPKKEIIRKKSSRKNFVKKSDDEDD